MLLLGLSSTCFLLVYFIEEDLNGKFVKVGVLNYNTYNDIVKKVREPNQIVHQDGLIIAQWYTNNNWLKQNYNIVLVFSKEGKFIRKHQETFFQGTPPNIWVGVRF